jgi:ectoine hydrolase
MDRRGIELLICPDPSNMSWLTGYDGWSFYTPRRCSSPTTPTRCGGAVIDANGAKRTVYMDHDASSDSPTTT